MDEKSPIDKKTFGGKWLKTIKIRKANVRRKRLDNLELRVGKQEKDAERRNADLLAFDAEEMIETNGSFRRARFLKETADKRLSETRLKIESANNELADYVDEIAVIDAKTKKVKNIETNENYEPNWAGKAEAWGKQHGVDDLVRYVDLPSGRVEVIDLHKARKAKTTVANDVWPSFFGSVAEEDPDKEGRAQRVEELFALAEGDPQLERMVGILSTKGMLHMVIVEALTLRDNVLSVCTDPEKLAEGRRAVADCEVVDAEAYKDNFE